MTALIPVLLLGTKYILDLRTLHKVQIENGDVEIEYNHTNETAVKAAKAVAENWNARLTLEQQKDAAYKVADAVYNDLKKNYLSKLSRVAKGIDSTRWKKSEKKYGIFDPFQAERSNETSIQTVAYDKKTCQTPENCTN